MLGIIGIAVLVGLGAGGIALYSGASILMALGTYMLVGWMFILAALITTCSVNAIKIRVRRQRHAYSG